MCKDSRTMTTFIMDVLRPFETDTLDICPMHHVFARIALFKTFPMMQGVHMFQVFLDFVVSGVEGLC